MPLPAQQVQAATVAGLHAEVPVGTQHLAWRAVTAGLAVPLAVLGGNKWGGGAPVSRKLCRRGREGKDEAKEEAEGCAEAEGMVLQFAVVVMF